MLLDKITLVSAPSMTLEQAQEMEFFSHLSMAVSLTQVLVVSTPASYVPGS